MSPEWTEESWRRRPELNRGWRFCRPLPYRLATAPLRLTTVRETDDSSAGLETGPTTTLDETHAEHDHTILSPGAASTETRRRRLNERMPYRLILLVGCLVLTAKYAFDPEASVPGRVTVGLATAASLFFPDSLKWYIAGILVQLTVSLFVILRFKLEGTQIRR